MKIFQRSIKLDIARTMAILCVILCHATEAIYMLEQKNLYVFDNCSKIFAIVLFTIGRLGVPIFLFLSGTLLLRKEMETDIDVLKFYKNNLLPLIIVNIIWTIIYNLFFIVTKQMAFVSIEYIIKELLFLKQVPAPQMWYFPMIIGMYIGIPFIAYIIKKFNIKTLSIILGLIIVSNFVLPTMNIISDMFGIMQIDQMVLSLPFLGTTYGVYMIVGYFVSNNAIKIKNIYAAIIAVLTFFITVLMQLVSYTKFSLIPYNVWYDNVFLLICSICIFILFNNMDDKKLNSNKKKFKIATYISKISLSLFFIHYIVQYIANHFIKMLNVALSLKTFILFLIVVIVSTLITIIFSKNKLISKYVLLIKN